MTNLRTAVAITLVSVFAACTGGTGDLPGSTDGGSSSSGGSSTSSSSGGSSSGGGGEIRASDFDQSCTGDQDCVAIYQGNACTPCACPNAAIAVADRQAYNDTRASFQCPQNEDIVCDACSAPLVACTAGTCAIKQ